MTSRVQFRLRVYRDEEVAIGPGKIDLLQAISQTGSISAAARQLGMSYRRAWVLVDEMARTLRGPAVATAIGGSSGGGAVLTPLGEQLVVHYRAMEQHAHEAAKGDIEALQSLLAP